MTQKCKNFEICNNSFPSEFDGCWGDGTCLDCDINWRER